MITVRLKRWESPRRQGRNDKGKGGSARARQIRKQFKMMSKNLKNTKEGSAPLFYSLSCANKTRPDFGLRSA
jgi:hypothetical protein